MNEVQVFESEQFGQVRTLEDESGKVLFCGSDVAKALGYAIPSKAVNTHCKGVSKMESRVRTGTKADGTPAMQTCEMLFITEGDVYRLITHSKLPAAEQFESWVFDEVLPTIRKTGGYVDNSELMVSSYFGDVSSEQKLVIKGLLDNIVAQQKKIASLTTANEALAAETLSWADRNLINALVRKYAANACDGDFRGAWREFKKELLYKHGINVNSRVTAYINTTGKKTKCKTLDTITDEEVVPALKTIMSMCADKGVDITDLLDKSKSSVCT